MIEESSCKLMIKELVDEGHLNIQKAESGTISTKGAGVSALGADIAHAVSALVGPYQAIDILKAAMTQAKENAEDVTAYVRDDVLP